MIGVIGYIAKFIRVLASQFTELRIVANTSLKGSIKMSAEYKKILAPHYKCPICGNLTARVMALAKAKERHLRGLLETS